MNYSLDLTQVESFGKETIEYILAVLTERSLSDRVDNLPTDVEISSGNTEGREDPDMALVYLLQRERATEHLKKCLSEISAQQKTRADLFLGSFDETSLIEVERHLRSKVSK